MKEAEREKINAITCDEPLYPRRLREIPDRPRLLYYKGGLPAEDMPSVAIIGARMCSEYGRRVAGEFAAGLAEFGIQVISGMASGIDGIAQKSALESGGRSYGILGCGVDICYPASNRPLYRMLEEKGGILSEYPPGTKPETWHFPRRNRIISGLADLILVVEAKEKSGTKITVNMALEQGKEVYAVPGRITDALSLGCLQMIRDGAGIAADIREVAEAAAQAWEKRGKYNAVEYRKSVSDSTMTSGDLGSCILSGSVKNAQADESELEKKILSLLAKREQYADEIWEGLLGRMKCEDGIPDIHEVQVCLTELVCRGRVACHGGVYEML